MLSPPSGWHAWIALQLGECRRAGWAHLPGRSRGLPGAGLRHRSPRAAAPGAGLQEPPQHPEGRPRRHEASKGKCLAWSGPREHCSPGPDSGSLRRGGAEGGDQTANQRERRSAWVPGSCSPLAPLPSRPEACSLCRKVSCLGEPGSFPSALPHLGLKHSLDAKCKGVA